MIDGVNLDWLSNPHADYVLAAYGLALAALAGLGIVSFAAARKARRRGELLQKKRS